CLRRRSKRTRRLPRALGRCAQLAQPRFHFDGFHLIERRVSPAWDDVRCEQRLVIVFCVLRTAYFRVVQLVPLEVAPSLFHGHHRDFRRCRVDFRAAISCCALRVGLRRITFDGADDLFAVNTAAVSKRLAPAEDPYIGSIRALDALDASLLICDTSGGHRYSPSLARLASRLYLVGLPGDQI